jgi:hypothetical protein
MIKINKKIQFICFALCLFLIGIGINDIIENGLKNGYELFRQLSAIIPFVIFGVLFFVNLYIKKEPNKL